MKNYDEMANDVLSRIKEYEAVRAKRKKTYIRFAYSFATVIIILVIGLNAAKLAKDNGKEIEKESGIDNEVEEPTLPDNIVWKEDGGANTGMEEGGYKIWHDKPVYYELYDVLQDCDEDTVFAVAIGLSFGAEKEFDEFIYNGKTGSEYAAEMLEQHELLEAMNGLLSDGNFLNAKIKESGEWQEDLYQEMINKYGEVLVAKYVEHGNRCMRESLNIEIEKLYEVYDKSYNEALEAYYKTLKTPIIENLKGQGILVQDTSWNQYLIMYVTAEEFARVDLFNVVYELAWKQLQKEAYWP